MTLKSGTAGIRKALTLAWTLSGYSDEYNIDNRSAGIAGWRRRILGPRARLLVKR